MNHELPLTRGVQRSPSSWLAVARRIAPMACSLAGAFALALFVLRQRPPIAVGAGVCFLVLSLGAVALFLGSVCAIGSNYATFPARQLGVLSELVEHFRVGTQRSWLSALPLVSLSASDWVTPSHRPLVLRVALGGTVACLAFSESRSLFVAGASLSAKRERSLSPAALCSLLFCVCAAAWFVIVAMHAEGSNDNDAAYYFGVARHMVKTGRFEEPILWQFLSPAAQVVHRPFDYWRGLTSLILVPPMWAFGPTHRVALLTMATVSGAGIFLFWYLITLAAPLRSRVAQHVALLCFATAPALKDFRFDTETAPVAHLLLLAALIAFAHRRLLWCTFLGFLVFWTRGDGAVVCTMLWLACLYVAWSRNDGRGPRSVITLLFAMCLLLAADMTFSFWAYGAPMPPGARLAGSLSSYADLFRIAQHASSTPMSARLEVARLGDAFWAAWGNLRIIPFLPQQPIFLVLILVVGWRSSRWPMTPLIFCLLFSGAAFIGAATGTVFSSHRTLYTMLPLVVLAVASALDRVLERRVVALVVLFCVGAALADVRPYGVRSENLAKVERAVRALDGALHGEVVAAAQPWAVMANSDSPSLMIPDGSEATLERAFRRYGVRWLVLGGQSCMGRAGPLCNAIADGSKTAIGDLQIGPGIRSGVLRAFPIISVAPNPCAGTL